MVFVVSQIDRGHLGRERRKIEREAVGRHRVVVAAFSRGYSTLGARVPSDFSSSFKSSSSFLESFSGTHATARTN